jgi:hypothetical protein
VARSEVRMIEERILTEQMVLVYEQGCMRRILFVDIGVDKVGD